MKQPTNRRQFIGTAALLGAGTALSAMPNTHQKHKKQLAHHVFFWLKHPTSTSDRDKLVEGVKSLASIPGVQALHVGIVAETEKREVVDNSWQVSELLFFEGLADQQRYQDHPTHLAFIRDYGHLWAKVVVYDAIEV